MNSPVSLPVGNRVADPTPAQLPSRRTFVGQSILLEPLNAARHGPALHAAAQPPGSQGEIWTYFGYGPFDDAVTMTAWLNEQEQKEDPLFFAVIDQLRQQPIGMTALQRIKPAMQCLEMGHIWFGPAFQRTAANTEAAYLLLHEAFNELGYRRVEWKCDALNARSRRAALRLGFRHEGIFAKHTIVKGRSRDTAWFSIIDDEWPTVRRNLETWLYETGDPRPSLAAMTAASQGEAFGQPRR